MFVDVGEIECGSGEFRRRALRAGGWSEASIRQRCWQRGKEGKSKSTRSAWFGKQKGWEYSGVKALC